MADYSVEGVDGQMYGPVDEQTLVAWAREGRLTAVTRVRDESTGALVPASQVPALGPVFNIAPPIGQAPPPPGYGAPQPVSPTVYPPNAFYSAPSGYTAPTGYAQPGYNQPGYGQPGYGQPGYASAPVYRPGDSQRVLAGLMGILFGGLGVHKFILGYTGAGILQIVISFVTCGVGSLIGLIEGIIYLCKTDEEFHQLYVVQKRNWF